MAHDDVGFPFSHQTGDSAAVFQGRKQLPVVNVKDLGSNAHKETLEGGAESARTILKAGGRLGMGGDYGFGWNPHGTYYDRLLLVESTIRIAGGDHAY
jgi:hypothetical protein